MGALILTCLSNGSGPNLGDFALTASLTGPWFGAALIAIAQCLLHAFGSQKGIDHLMRDCSTQSGSKIPENVEVLQLAQCCCGAGETMVSGITGEEFAADIFVGPVYYQRLRHMVSDKFQASLCWCLAVLLVAVMGLLRVHYIAK